MLNAGSKSTSVLGLRLLQSYVPLRTDRSANVSASSIYIRSRTLISSLSHATSPPLRFGSVTGIRPMKASLIMLLCVQAPNEHV